MNKIFHIGSTFEKSLNTEDNELYINGMASTKDIDRMGDTIPSEAWTKGGGLDNYKNNPIILFNHDYNRPIGRAVELSTDDNGLQLKAKIAKSAGDVRNLIEDGVLGAFSVGFRVKDAEYLSETDGFRIKDAELLEVSVVSIPANQAATFSLAKSFDSDSEYEEFKKSFTQDSQESMPTDLEEVEAQEKTMSDIDIDAIVAATVEKTAAAMAMKEAERKAADEAAATKAAEEEAEKAAQSASIVTAVETGAEKLLADVEAKLAEKDANFEKLIGELSSELKEKSAEIEAIRNSKRVFADRAGLEKGFTEDQAVEAHILGVVTQKGMDTKLGRDIMEKVNENGGVQVSASTTADFESTVSTAIEKDIELELVIDPMFRKLQMNAASMVVPLMPDAGYAEFTSAAGAGSGSAYKGNLEARGDTVGSPYNGLDMTSKVLTTGKLVSNSYLANETEEDAILPILPLIRDAMVRSHARAIEHSLLLGASAGNDLISSPYNGLVAVSEANAGTDVLTAAGTAASPADLTVTNPADELLRMRQSMGKYGRRPGDVMYIVSLDYYYQLLQDADFQNINEVGDQRATKITGEIGNVFGSPVVVCDEFPGAAAGEPCAVAVNPMNFVVPVLRGVTIEQDYEVANQRRVLVASQRRGFDNMFSTAGQAITLKYAS